MNDEQFEAEVRETYNDFKRYSPGMANTTDDIELAVMDAIEFTWSRAINSDLEMSLFKLNQAPVDDREFALEMAINLLTELGYRDPEEPDKMGDEVGDIAQTMLAELMLRIPRLADVMAPTSAS